MTDLTPDHPAVKAAVADQSFGTLRRLHGTNRNNPQQVLGLMRNILRTAIRNLTADDIRGTDVAEEIRTEGWMQGWAAGRDLDGDEDATPYLRDTPAGRALMAEAWKRGLHRGYEDGIAQAGHMPPNPYRDPAS